MQLILEPKVKEIEYEGLTPLSLIERVGRTCYKSTSEYTEETARKFFNMLASKGHYSMFEHANLVFQLNTSYWFEEVINCTAYDTELINALRYFNVTQFGDRILISGSIRAFNECTIYPIRNLLWKCENDGEEIYHYDTTEHLTSPCPYTGNLSGVRYIKDLNTLSNLTSDEVLAHTYMTLDIECDRGITHELVRHRNCAFAQESTRYCNYTADKFGDDIYFMRPPEIALKDLKKYEKMKQAYADSEKLYKELVTGGLAPEFARGILPTALKSEIVITANLKEWKHIIDLRYKETTGKVHPHIKQVAKKAKEFYDKKLLSVIG